MKGSLFTEFVQWTTTIVLDNLVIRSFSLQAVISKNLFVTRLKDYRSAPCCKETTGKNCTAPIKLANPSFEWDHSSLIHLHSFFSSSSPSNRDGDGTVHLTWPSCFDMGIDVTLPPGMIYILYYFVRFYEEFTAFKTAKLKSFRSSHRETCDEIGCFYSADWQTPLYGCSHVW